MTELMGLNIFDIVVIGLILLLSIKGLLNGFTKELFGAIGLIGGIFVASYFHKTVAEYIHNNITDALSINALNLLSLIVIFILFLTIVTYIGKGVALLGNNDSLSITSRLGGMLIKIIKLFFIFALIVFAFSTKAQVTEKFKDTLDNSKLYPLLKNAGATILNMPIISNVNLNKKVPTHNENNENKTTELNTTKAQELNKTEENNKTEIKKELKTNELNNTSKEDNTTTEVADSKETNATNTEDNNTKEIDNQKIDTNSIKESNSTKVEDTESNNSKQDTNNTEN